MKPRRGRNFVAYATEFRRIQAGLGKEKYENDHSES